MPPDNEKARRQKVVELLAAMPAFRSSEAAVPLLQHLNDHEQGLKSTELANYLFKKKPKEERSSTLRNLVYRVRQWLEDAYADPASPLQQYPRAEIHIDRRIYSLRFVTAGTHPRLTEFWKPYLVCADNARQIQTSDRSFLRFGDHFYFRDIRSPGRPNWADLLEPLCEVIGIRQVSLRAEALGELQERVLSDLASDVAAFLSKPDNWLTGEGFRQVEADEVLRALVGKFSPEVSRHYVSAGEAVALTHLAEMFQRFQKPVIFGNRAGTATDNESANIVQVGKPREGGVLAEILSSQRYRIGKDRIEDRDDPENRFLLDELRTHADDVTNAPSGRAIKYALVTRCPHRKEPQIITSIVASHGRVTEAACRHLTTETSMAEIFKQLGWDARPIDARFQFVLKAEVSYGKDSDRTIATIKGVEAGWHNSE